MPNDRKGKSRALPGDANGNGESQDFLALDIDGDRGESGVGVDGYQQMQLVEQQVSLSSRLILTRTYSRIWSTLLEVSPYRLGTVS